MSQLIDQLKSEPSLSWKVSVEILGNAPDSPAAMEASRATRNSTLVSTLLKNRDLTGHPYRKWIGSHWILSLLADLGCPAGDESLRPLMDETFACYLGKKHEKYIRQIAGRTRRCASQEGNAIWSSMRLGFMDERTNQLVSRLLQWQWPDGGWNCDKRPEAGKSSFMETLIPLRALALYARTTGDREVKHAAERAAEIFLKRHMYKRGGDGEVMDAHFTLLHYPAYWHYDILFGLKVMAEAGFITDPRCGEALDLLELKRLPGGGFPAEESYSRATRPQVSGYSPVPWGGKSIKKMNPFVTADALYVLGMAGRKLDPSSHE